MTIKWELTAEAFGRFLVWLDADRTKAGQKYEAIRRRLVVIFVSRGCPDAEELADETINRVIRRSQDMADSYQGEPIAYFIKVAHHLHQEYVKRRARLAELPTDLPLPFAPDPDEDLEHKCLEECMRELSLDNRNLVLEYYKENKQAKIDHRKKLAKQLGIGLNALRIRAHRLRVVLERCIEACLD